MSTAQIAAGTAAGARLLVAVAPDLLTHARRFGEVPWRGRPRALVAEVGSAGLCGHGGAGFPTGRKMSAVWTNGSRRRRAVVVANAAEGEPASAKDATLLSHAPHLVLDGLQLAAEAVAADEAYVYAAGALAPRVRRAMAERRRAHRDRVPVRLHTAPDAFVAGEESAVVSAIEGGPALPRFKRHLLVESGLRGRPTLVQNVETLAHVALVARHGAAWFRAVGTADEPGTFLATVGGAVAAPGVVEAPYGVGVADLLAQAGGPTAPLSAVLVGGYHGAWIPGRAVNGLAMSRESLSAYGATPGAGVVLVLPVGTCGLDVTARVVSYLAGQSAGSCGPCVHGLPHLADSFAHLAWGLPTGSTIDDVGQLTDLVTQRGACRHPDGTARLVRSTLRTFADDVEAHVRGECTAREER